MQAVPWEDEAEQQLSRLALSACELFVDVRIFKGRLTEAPSTDPECYVARLSCQDWQAAPVSVQHHSSLQLSAFELSVDVCIFSAGIPEAPGTNP